MVLRERERERETSRGVTRGIRMRCTSRHDGFLYTYIKWYMTPGQLSPIYIRIAATIKFYGRASGERRLFRTR